MKKFLGILLTIAMLTAVFAPCAMAAETEEYKAALAIVKERFGIEGESKTFDSNMSKSGSTAIYRFLWRYDDDTEIEVEYGSDGVVRNYQRYSRDGYNHGDTSFRKYELSEYKEKALQIIKKTNPKIADNIVLDQPERYSLLDGDVSFPFTFEVNGVKVRGFEGSVTLKSDDASLAGFYIGNYADVEYADKAGFIDREKAVLAYKELFGMKLVYEIKYDYSERTRTAKALYIPSENSGEYVNALTGEKYEAENDIIMYGAMKNEAMAEDSGGSASFSRAEMSEISNVENLMSVDEVVKKLRQIKALKISASDKVLRSRCTKDVFSDNYYYNITLGSDDSDSFYITADAKDGRVINYSKYIPSKSKSKISEKTAKELGKKYVRELAGELLEQYGEPEQNEYGLNYQRIVNGAEVTQDTMHVYVDEYDGSLNYYNISYTDMEFPTLDNIIDADAAADALFAAVDYSPVYLTVRDKDYNITETAPVYAMEGKSFKVDPFTGEIVKPEHTYGVKDPIKYTDIEGHYAQQQIEKLAQYGIGFDRELFNPDSAAVQKDYITLLVKTFSNIFYEGDDADDVYYENAIASGIITEEERDETAPVTRMQAAVFMIRAMGAEKYARLNGIWVCPFSDITENVGYAALLYGMNIVKGDENGRFNPNENITNAESAIMIYNSLSKE